MGRERPRSSTYEKSKSIQIAHFAAGPPLTKYNQVDGRWTSKNAGGNCTFPTFMVNPQYHLRIHPPKSRVGSNASGKARTTLSLQASKDVPVNVAIVWSQGQRIVEYVALFEISLAPF